MTLSVRHVLHALHLIESHVTTDIEVETSTDLYSCKQSLNTKFSIEEIRKVLDEPKLRKARSYYISNEMLISPWLFSHLV